MNLSDLAGRPVLDLATATNIGKVADFVIDPVTRRIVGFQLANVKGPAYWLAWDAMNTLGADALTIDRPDVLTEPPEHSRGLRADKVIGGRVLDRLRSGTTQPRRPRDRPRHWTDHRPQDRRSLDAR